MKVSLNWLKDYVDISNLKPEEIADRLTNSGFEVEDIEIQNKYLKNIVVGKILEISKHPEADKLLVCQVCIGESNVQILTNTHNIFVGALVPVCLEGAVLNNGMKITPCKIRGVHSDGMFCSIEELGIPENYYNNNKKDQIVILKDDCKIGDLIENALNLNDVILDVSVTSNRPDAQSTIGIAKEISAIFDIPFKAPSIEHTTNNLQNKENLVSIEIENYELCPRYTAAIVENVKIEDSPEWLKNRLVSAGIKPICNIVDITNYVLLEYGQPMHAFDRKNIISDKIIVRPAKDGEEIHVLNDKSYKLTPKNLVIANVKEPMVIAGVIGGTDSSINDNTETVVFEAASFELSSIRLTSKQLGVRTDSSSRFEKGVYPGTCMYGLERALHLVEKLHCGKITNIILDNSNQNNYERDIVGSINKINNILGIKIPEDKILSILNNLGIKTVQDGDKLLCHIPYDRLDIENNNDLAEEIIRIYGYENFDLEEKPYELTYSVGKDNRKNEKEFEIRELLCNSGFNEILNYSMCNIKTYDKMLIKQDSDLRNMVKIANPISEELGYMRTTMAVSMFNTLEFNYSHNNKILSLYECGTIYDNKIKNELGLPKEENIISIACLNDKHNFFDLKAIVERIIGLFELKYSIKYSSLEFLHPGISADFIDKKNKNVIASIGKIHPKVMQNFDIASTGYYAEINLTKLLEFNDKKIKCKQVSKLPLISRDLAVVVQENIECNKLTSCIKNTIGEMCYSIELFDIFRSETLGKNLKSMAFNIKIQSYDKTLTDEEINGIINKVIAALEKNYGAKLR